MRANPHLLSFISLLICAVPAIDCFARAGGSSGSGFGLWKIILFIFLLPFVLIYMAIRGAIMSRKKSRAKQLAEKLEVTDPLWNQRHMKARAEEIFFKLQEAWMARNMNLAEGYISQRLSTKYRMQTEDMISRGVKNYMKDIRIEDVAIFSVEDYRDNNKDSFSARISGSMLDFELDETSNIVTKGDRNKSHYFEDVYVFIRENNYWIADEVDNSVSLGDISKGRAFSEG